MFVNFVSLASLICSLGAFAVWLELIVLIQEGKGFDHGIY